MRVEGIDAILRISDMVRSRNFYVGKLGFNEAQWGNNDFTYFSKDGSGIYVCRGAQGCPGTWVWIGFDGNIFALHQELKDRGVRIKMEPTNFSWAFEMQVEDPDGHVLRFGTSPDRTMPFLDALMK